MPDSVHCRRISLPRRGVATLLGWACGLALLAGCQSTAERDVVQRELRQQEDQIYQLQDCLNDYQQIICQYRRENETLKQKSVQDQFRDGKPSTTSKSGKAESSRLKDTPIPPTAPRSGAPSDDSELVPPGVPPLELNQPAQLPSKSTSNDGTPDATLAEERPAESSEAVQASYEQPIIVALTAAESAHQSDDSATTPSANVSGPIASEASACIPVVAAAIRGGVFRDESMGGPRMLVEVAPLDVAGDRTDFSGSLSLMVVDHTPDGKRKDVARWDFSPDELARYTKPHKVGTSWAFPLQLPADVPADRPIELWVRLMPQSGSKVLCHTAVDVGREGQFASTRPDPNTTPSPSEHEATPATAVAASEPRLAPSKVVAGSTPAVHRDENVLQSRWTIARPGSVTEEAPSSAQPAVGSWRTATQTIPVVESQPVLRGDAPSAGRYADRYAQRRKDPPQSTATTKSSTTDWSPMRSGDSAGADDDGVAESSAAHVKPTWSASR